MSIFLTAYLIVGVIFALNDLYDLEGMAIIVAHPKSYYWIGCVAIILFWFPILVHSIFYSEDNSNNRPGGPTPT